MGYKLGYVIYWLKLQPVCLEVVSTGFGSDLKWLEPGMERLEQAVKKHPGVIGCGGSSAQADKVFRIQRSLNAKNSSQYFAQKIVKERSLLNYRFWDHIT